MSDQITVLLVEDNDADARYVRELFAEVGSHPEDRFPGLDGAGDSIEFVREHTLAGALDRLDGDADRFAVVLLDLHLGDSEGLATLEAVLETTRRVPVVVLTGMDDTSVGAAAIQAGAQDYLVKDDLRRDMLERTIRYAIQRHRTQQSLRERTEQLQILNQLTRHDVRNDMSLVVGRTTALYDEVDERYRDTLGEILTASNHVLQLTRTIGDTVEAIADTDASALGPVDLCAVLQREVETARSRYDIATIDVVDPCEDIEVRADRLLSAVFGNLLGNAVVYNDRDSPTVQVEIDPAPDTVTVHIADDGPGIPPRQKRQLFTSESGDLDGSGLGIGLYLVRRLVDRYEGSIDITDNEPRGAVFSVTLRRA